MRQKRGLSFVIAAIIMSISIFLVYDKGLQAQDVELVSHVSYYRFELKLGDNNVVEIYDECYGLGSSNEIIEETVTTDDGNSVIIATPGPLRWHPIHLKRIGPSSGAVWHWWREAMVNNNTEEAFRDGTITMFSAFSTDPIARWAFRQGWAASLQINGNAEELIIVHEGLKRVNPTGVSPGGGR
jgi:hypothetical protein